MRSSSSCSCQVDRAAAIKLRAIAGSSAWRVCGLTLPHRQAAGITRARGSTRSAASTVFISSIVMVIGPTPPGTGVMWAATSRTAGGVDIATQFAVDRRGSCPHRSRSHRA